MSNICQGQVLGQEDLLSKGLAWRRRAHLFRLALGGHPDRFNTQLHLVHLLRNPATGEILLGVLFPIDNLGAGCLPAATGVVGTLGQSLGV